MGNDARPSRKDKDDETSNLKGKQSSDKGLSTSSSATSDTFGLRRSSREALVKKNAVPASPTVRKSERIEKRVSMTPTNKGKLDKVGKKSTPSPLRRSDRGKSSFSPSSASKRSDKSSSSLSLKRKKGKKEKSVKQLTLETEEVGKSETQALKHDRVKKKRKRLNAASYMGWFKTPKSKKVKAVDETIEDHDGGNEPSGSSTKPACGKEAHEFEDGDLLAASSTGESAMLLSNDAVTEKIDDEPDAREVNCSTMEKANEPNLMDSPFNETTMEDQRGIVDDQEIMDVDSVALGTSASKEVCASIADTASVLPSDCIRSSPVQKFDANLKRQRVNLDSKGGSFSSNNANLNQELAVTSLTMVGLEVEVLDVDELRQEREFRVKYKGLAHIHNRWVSESKLLLEAASLVEKFNRENQVARWNPEWVVPDCLLRKRLLMSPEQHDQNLTNQDREKLNGHYEWLVKWRGLDCKHATWELDNSVFFSSAYGESLIKEYENRQSGASSSKVDKILEGENCSSVKLSQLQSGMSSRLDSDLSDHITKLREFWLKGQNAVVIDEQERILMVISLIQSFQPKTCRPFLIISTSAALHLWDDEFIRLVNFVVYNGNKDLRSIIRKLEFNEGGCPMFQVLITTLDIVLEALDVLRSVEWELIIIDELQCTRISSHCAQIKLLATKRRLLLVSGQLKGSTAEYLNLLSLLESPSDLQNGVSLLTSSSDNIGKLKEKFSRYIAYRSKSESSFKEYWVPVQMSNVQLEQYCGSLMSNSVLLCSSSKHDIVGAFHEVLMSCQKCCNHPFTVDRSIQRSLTEGLKGVEFLNAAIKASGKLQLLEMMLLEIQKRGLRVLILFQDFGKDNIGYVLEDLLIQKFGENSYERVDHGLTPAKKNTALNNFNRERGRFVFLIETRACLSSIKLSSVDTVIIYASDWNPLIDVRALQKITLDSKPEQVTVFRLYSPYTLEEKVLILAKQGKFLDSKLENISLAISHMLLMWGASHQFKTLDEFHAEGLTASPAKSLSKEPSLEDIIQDFLQILSSNGKDSGSSTILNVPQVGGVYHSESPLFGELRSEVMDKVQPHLFWTQLLGGKHPQWKYISGSSQRNRKRVHYSEESAKNTETESDEAVKKRKKLINSKVAPPTIELGSAAKPISGCRVGACGTPADNLRNCLPRSTARINEMICANSASSSRLGNNFLEIPQDHNIESEERREMRDAQKILHLSLKPEILELCKILKLSV
ncbi:histone H3-K9 methyltransferase [Parasponia andersonii]|uniref:Histone H3-K9 methyltransferase n=1 Tax=Parasponia andersonii TaxID=3476 RepID=A0A2P5B1A8_PARAD|nr:histone H3-K9 methyltransferase [Parasponia andersonii]